MLTLLRQVLRKLTGRIIGGFLMPAWPVSTQAQGPGCFWKLLGHPQHGIQALGKYPQSEVQDLSMT